jgi:hypothetical protein
MWYLVFVGFSVNYMIRININIALIDMLDATFKKSSLNQSSECLIVDKLLLNNSSAIRDVQHVNKQIESNFLSIERKLLETLSVGSIVYHLLSRSDQCDINLLLLD